MSLNTAARRATAIGVAALLLAAPAAAHADAPPAPGNSAGILTLLDAGGAVLASGSTTAQPAFAAALAPAPCPADFADAARLSLVPAGGRAIVISATVPLADPAVPATVPVSAVLADYGVEQGATVALECLAVQGGIPLPATAVFSVGLDVAGSHYTVVPAPVLPTQPPVKPSPTSAATPSVPATDKPAQEAAGGADATVQASTAPGGATAAGKDGLAATGATLLPLILGAAGLAAAGAATLLWRRGRRAA